jgi:hypothetical protein
MIKLLGFVIALKVLIPCLAVLVLVLIALGLARRATRRRTRP